MTPEEALFIIGNIPITSGDDCYSITEYQEAKALAMAALIEKAERDKADGCKDCAFDEYEEWQLPCRVCANARKNYWRKKPE